VVNEEEFVQLTTDCVHVCDVLRAGIKRRDTDCLNESVKKAISDLEQSVISVADNINRC